MTTSPNDDKLRAMAARGLVPAEDAAKRLGVSLSTVYRLMNRKRLAGMVENKRWRWVSLRSLRVFRANGAAWTVIGKIEGGSLFATRDGRIWLKMHGVIGPEPRAACILVGSGTSETFLLDHEALELDAPVMPEAAALAPPPAATTRKGAKAGRRRK